MMFETMFNEYSAELSKLEIRLEADKEDLKRLDTDANNTELFLELARKYTNFTELTPAMINEFVSKIMVHEATGIGAHREQDVEIYLNYVGKVELPHPAPSPHG